MKNINLKPVFYFWILSLSLLLTTSMKCKKDPAGIESLPPATQEGKNTFGCLVDGEVFLPKGNFSNSPITCAYQFSSSSGNSGYYFILTITNIGKSYTNTLQLLTDSIKFTQNSTYRLKTHVLNSKGVAFSRYVKSNNANFQEEKYNSNDQFGGEMKITKLDEVNQIISGTFWFDAVNERGEKVAVTEGRFDMTYIK